MRILVLGAGVIGSVYAGKLLEAGHEVVLLARGSRLADAASGTTPAATTQYGYTATGALASVTPPTGPVISYTSNGNNLRQSRTAGGVITPFTWATAGKLPLLLDDGTHTYLYGPSLSPIAQIDDTTRGIEYVHDDLLGSPRLISNPSGTITGATTYDPYGNRTTHTGTADTTIGYSGNWTDPTTGLVYLRARDYDPQTAQFVTVDPLLSTSHQPYAYVGNDPLGRVDPTGRFQWDVGLIAALVSSGTGILGLAFDSTVLGGVIGLPLEAISLAAGAVAISADCGGAFGTKQNAGSCALDIAGEASASVGSAVDGAH